MSTFGCTLSKTTMPQVQIINVIEIIDPRFFSFNEIVQSEKISSSPPPHAPPLLHMACWFSYINTTRGVRVYVSYVSKWIDGKKAACASQFQFPLQF